MTNASEWMALSYASCKFCFGTGVRLFGVGHVETVCNCCNRGVCRSVVRAYKFYSESIGQTLRSPQLSDGSNRQARRTGGNRQAEWCADVWLCAKRNLTPRQWQIFRRHHIGGEQWNQFGIEWGVFWHEKYRLEQILGRVFRELKPYALFPTDEYFHESSLSLSADVRPCAVPAPRYPNGRPLVPPLAAPAQPVRAVQQPRTPAVVVVMPAPAVPDDIYTAEDHIKRKFREGVGLGSIADSLAKHGFTPPNGKKWVASDVKRILLMVKRAA